jgi:hypothetical protein
MILLEGSESEMTTGQWWEKKGRPYTGNLKDEPYFVYQDKSGQQRVGSVTFPGDPYTYEVLPNDRLRVMSGPTQKSIGAVIQKPSRADFVKKVPDGPPSVGTSGAATPPQKMPPRSNDDIVKSIAVNISLMCLYLVKSITYMQNLKDTCLEKSPNQIISVVSATKSYVDTNQKSCKQMIQELSQLTRDKMPDITKMNIVQPGPAIEQIESLSSSSIGMSVSFSESLQYLNRVKRGIKELEKKSDYSWKRLNQETRSEIDAALDVLAQREPFLNADSAQEFMSLNIIKQGNSYSRVVFGPGASKEQLFIDGAAYQMSALRKELDAQINDIKTPIISN